MKLSGKKHSFFTVVTVDPRAIVDEDFFEVNQWKAKACFASTGSVKDVASRKGEPNLED